MNNNDEYFFTMGHFSQIDLNKKLSDSNGTDDSDDSDNSNKSNDSDDSGDSNNSDDSNDSDDSDITGISTETDDSGNDDVDDNEDDSSVNMEIDKDDQFNTKTNGNEFYGEVLKNRYLILKKLGYGSFSSVWMSYDIETSNLVAIKIINPQDYNEGLLELQTYRKLEKLDHTYLLTMNECFQVTPIHQKYFTESYKKKYKKERDHIVIVLPLLAGSTYELLKCKEYDDGLPLEVCKNIILQTLLGIKELEKHDLMHTDLKPENILVCGLNREEEVLLKTIHDIDIKTVHNNQLLKIFKDKPSMSEAEKWLASYKLYREITRTIIKFMNQNMKEIKEQMKNCRISSKYIKDIKIKICDFNLVLNTSENLNNDSVEIQTRYYRAPEIIIGSGLHKKTDYWSIGCVLFELLTGEILFDPEKDESTSRDIYHMYLIEELMGQTPKNMIKNARKRNRIYDDKGFLIGVGKKVKRWELKDVLKDNHDNLALSDNIIDKVVKFINATLNINPDNRPAIKTMIETIKDINI